MPVVANDDHIIGGAHKRSDMYAYAKAFLECTDAILKEESVDYINEPQKTMRFEGANQGLRKFFTEGWVDPNAQSWLSEEEIDDINAMAEQHYENDVKGLLEHSPIAEYNPIVGMALPIHKFILMNNVFDKGAIQKVVADKPKFTVSLERRILVNPDGTEIDMFLQQNSIADAIEATNPTKVIDLELPVTEDLDVVATYFGGTVLDDLDISTAITAVQVKNVQFDEGDILPDADGYINKTGEVATETTTKDVWFRVNIPFKPNYGGPNHYERTVTMPVEIVYKDGANGGAVTTLKAVISGSMNKNRFNIVDFNGKIKNIQLSAKLDTSNAMLETVHTKWEVTTDLVEIPNATPVSVTIAPQETKDISAMYNVNQVTKQMELIKTTLGEYKDMKIKRFLDASYERLDDRNGFYDKFDFAPRTDYALSHVEWRHATFMDFLDHHVSKMLQVLNDPNMTVTIFGDPLIVRKITPKEYTYTAPATIGPVTLNYTQTIVNMSDKRVYNFIGTDKMRNTDQLMIILNPHNSERIIYRIYDYQLYIGNEVRSIVNPALPNLYAFERFLPFEYQPCQSRIDILNPSGLTQ